MNEQAIADMTPKIKALANEMRLRVVTMLVQSDELSVGEIVSRVGLSQSALSQHLAKMRNTNMVQTRQVAQTVYYSVTPETETLYQAIMATHNPG